MGPGEDESQQMAEQVPVNNGSDGGSNGDGYERKGLPKRISLMGVAA